MQPIPPIAYREILDARARVRGFALHTPLVPLELRGGRRIWLKLEALQPIGSFKIRGAANALALATPEDLAAGVYTGSAGNMAQGLAYAASHRGIACRVVVPDTAPRTKLDAIETLGATAVRVPFDEWWSVLRDHGHPDETGHFVHPVSDRRVIAGHGTAGLEILQDLPSVKTVVVPYGGGGFSAGIASALSGHPSDGDPGSAQRSRRAPITVLAAEVDTAAPFAASLRAGKPVDVERIPSFVDGIGGKGVLPEMWPLTSALLSGSIVTTLDQVREAVRRLVTDANVVAEGAGAAALAAALTLPPDRDPIVAVISGGNIDTEVLRTILAGGRS